MIHQLKIESRFYNDIETGGKRFEVRHDDRGYQVSDVLAMSEITNGGVPTGKMVYVLVTYIHRNDIVYTWLREGYIIMGFDIIRWIHANQR